MAEPQIQFNDGAAYEQMMGVWSQLAGRRFLDWLAPAPGLRWIDVGCGNGAFTELLIERCAPAAVDGVDPSEGQLAFARSRPGARIARFGIGDAMALPFPATSFDAAVMALVIFFVPDPAAGVVEMIRVVRPGGLVCAYAWDMPGGGFPLEPVQSEMRALGLKPLRPPQADISEIGALGALWREAGLEAVSTHTIAVERSYASFEAFWSVVLLSPTLAAAIAAMPADDAAALQQRLRRRLPADADGRITYGARANAVQGRVPA